MEKPSVVSIFVTSGGSQPLNSISTARAVAGQGIEGDRYFDKTGTFSKKDGGGREITLIEAEALEALTRDCNIPFVHAESRRNIVTRGVALNHLVGKEFRVGDVKLRGIRLCEPCGHLEKLTRAGVKEGLLHRGGLRADIIESGTINVGDSIIA